MRRINPKRDICSIHLPPRLNDTIQETVKRLLEPEVVDDYHETAFSGHTGPLHIWTHRGLTTHTHTIKLDKIQHGWARGLQRPSMAKRLLTTDRWWKREAVGFLHGCGPCRGHPWSGE